MSEANIGTAAGTAAMPPPGGAGLSARQVQVRAVAQALGMLPVLVVLAVAFHYLSEERFLTAQNLSIVSQQAAINTVLAAGMTFVILTGGIDLSVGSLVAASGVVAAALSPHGSLAAALGGVGAAALVGALNGLVVTRARLQPFVVTLCGLLLYRGIARWYTNDGTAGFAFGQSFPTLEWLAAGRTFGVPHSFIAFILVALAMAVLLHRSVYGRYLFAVGRNEEAARYSGIRTRAIVASARPKPPRVISS